MATAGREDGEALAKVSSVAQVLKLFARGTTQLMDEAGDLYGENSDMVQIQTPDFR